MFVLDADIVVPPLNIKFGKMFHIFEFVNEVGDEWERVGILDGVFVQVVIILAGVEFPILFFDEENRRGLGRVGGVDLS